MEKFKTIPFQPYMAAFEQLERITNVASLSEADRARYDESLKVYRDNMAVLAFAKREGREEGMEEGMEKEKLSIARSLKSAGVDVLVISQSTGLSLDQISAL